MHRFCSLLIPRPLPSLSCAVFSAPDYPQFMDEESRYFNKAAVAVLRPSTSYVEPEFLQFSAVLPRPPARVREAPPPLVCSF